jgi:hypothetical protein
LDFVGIAAFLEVFTVLLHFQIRMTRRQAADSIKIIQQSEADKASIDLEMELGVAGAHKRERGDMRLKLMFAAAMALSMNFSHAATVTLITGEMISYRSSVNCYQFIGKRICYIGRQR